MVCEFIDGMTLNNVIKLLISGKRINLAIFFTIAKGLLATLSYMNKNPKILAHRDIKPANIILCKNFEPILIDFSTVHSKYRVRHTLSTLSIGTPRYMAPEQRGCPDSSNIRSDIFSLGLVLSELAIGLSVDERKKVAPLLKIMCEEDRMKRPNNPLELYKNFERVLS
jgi:serine/threonine-protein kinase